MNILGISALYHDSAAALVCDGKIVAAASEERFTRVKADASIPRNAIEFCLTKIPQNQSVDYVVYYDNPLLTLDRWLENCVVTSPYNEKIINKTFDSMFSSKLWIHEELRKVLGKLGKNDELYICEHHISHAASAFYPSPFKEAAIITMDGVGEWATTTIGKGNDKDIEVIEEITYPNSLGLLYSAFTYFCGFKVNFGEYKLMGLAPYGQAKYVELIKKELVDIKKDGSFKLNMDYFSFANDIVMTGKKFEELFGVKRRIPEEKISKIYMDIAASIQVVTEEIVIKIARHAKEITGCKNLVMAGGIALNCVANGKLLKENIFEEIWIQPAAGDAGGALGAALYATYVMGDIERKICEGDSQNGSCLGPEYSECEIKDFLDENNISYLYYQNNEIYDAIAKFLQEDKIIGLFNGRMEFGPRALGNRSIIANPLSQEMQSKLNLKIKFRESFRPFAPAVLSERVSDYFDIDVESPYMLLVAGVREDICDKCSGSVEEWGNYDDIDMLKIINQKRSELPAITHVDYSARVQTVDKKRKPYFYNVIKAFETLTGCGVVVNTSFNVRGEPIVCTPKDAYLCFMRTNMDILVLENFVLFKEMQKPIENDENWREIYELD